METEDLDDDSRTAREETPVDLGAAESELNLLWWRGRVAPSSSPLLYRDYRKLPATPMHSIMAAFAEWHS